MKNYALFLCIFTVVGCYAMDNQSTQLFDELSTCYDQAREQLSGSGLEDNIESLFITLSSKIAKTCILVASEDEGEKVWRLFEDSGMAQTLRLRFQHDQSASFLLGCAKVFNANAQNRYVDVRDRCGFVDIAQELLNKLCTAKDWEEREKKYFEDFIQQTEDQKKYFNEVIQQFEQKQREAQQKKEISAPEAWQEFEALERQENVKAKKLKQALLQVVSVAQPSSNEDQELVGKAFHWLGHLSAHFGEKNVQKEEVDRALGFFENAWKQKIPQAWFDHIKLQVKAGRVQDAQEYVEKENLLENFTQVQVGKRMVIVRLIKLLNSPKLLKDKSATNLFESAVKISGEDALIISDIVPAKLVKQKMNGELERIVKDGDAPEFQKDNAYWLLRVLYTYPELREFAVKNIYGMAIFAHKKSENFIFEFGAQKPKETEVSRQLIEDIRNLQLMAEYTKKRDGQAAKPMLTVHEQKKQQRFEAKKEKDTKERIRKNAHERLDEAQVYLRNLREMESKPLTMTQQKINDNFDKMLKHYDYVAEMLQQKNVEHWYNEDIALLQKYIHVHQGVIDFGYIEEGEKEKHLFGMKKNREILEKLQNIAYEQNVKKKYGPNATVKIVISSIKS